MILLKNQITRNGLQMGRRYSLAFSFLLKNKKRVHWALDLAESM